MGGFQICESDGRSPHTLKANEIEPYLKDHTITVSAEDILDKSKGDFLSKALVLLQVFWFILQVLARITQHLAITELELVTLGYAILNFIVYFCWWNKPFDVHYPIKFNKQPSSKSSKTSLPMPATNSSTASSITPTHEGGDLEDGPYASGTFTDKEKNASFQLACVVATIFRGIHCMGWDFEFPTKLEAWLWRTSSITITSIPICLLLLNQSNNAIQWTLTCVHSQLCHSKPILLVIPLQMVKAILSSLSSTTSVIKLGMTFLLYPLARLVLLVQMFVVLRNPDPGIHTSVDWVTYIPHF
ncbi:hypothetical protein J132_03807 [Termitomyces sp. J132]|nr:hypothetical protein J132_03807 [Termitomyces sp. J132]